MKNIVLTIILGVAILQGWQWYDKTPSPSFDGAYIAVYGSNSSESTLLLLKGLKAKGIEYHFFNVDEQVNTDDLKLRMESSGISTKRVSLPVVDISGAIYIRPDLAEVIAEYKMIQNSYRS